MALASISAAVCAAALMVSCVICPASAASLSFPSAATATGRVCLTRGGALGRCVSALKLECSLFSSVNDLLVKRPQICAFSKMDAVICCPLEAIVRHQGGRLPRPQINTPVPTRPTPAPSRRTPVAVPTRSTSKGAPPRPTSAPTRRTPTPPPGRIPDPTRPRPTPLPPRRTTERTTSPPTTRSTTRAQPTSPPRTRRTTSAPASPSTRPTSTPANSLATATPLPGIPRLPTGISRRAPAPRPVLPVPRFSIPVRQPGCGLTSPFLLFRQLVTGRYMRRPPRFGRFSSEQLGTAPWTALVGTTDDAGTGRWVCVGALLSPRLLLTAAHCAVLGGSPDRLVVGLGDHDLVTTSDGGGELFRVSEVLRHPAWRPPARRHDLALLVMQRPAASSPRVNFICLPPPDAATTEPDSQHEPVADTTLSLAAYHLDVHNLNTSVGGRGRLLSSASSVRPLSTCRRFLREDPLSEHVLPGGPQHDSELCMSVAGCETDAGAPLASVGADGRVLLEGVAMLDGCAQGSGMVVVRVRKYVPWILHTMQNVTDG